MSTFKINKRGFWESEDSSGHVYDRPLSNAIIRFFAKENARSIVDLGCGMGSYTKALIADGFNCDAYDGNPNTVLLTKGIGKVLDLSVLFDLNKKFDWILCLEVGEHIPKEFEKIFLNNVVNHADKGIIISWGIPGQPGDGHVNCRSNNYIIDQMKKRGFKNDAKAAKFLRNESTFSWFKNTVMAFRKNESSNSFFDRIRSLFN